MQFPFEVPFEEVRRNPDVYVDAVFSCLQSEFLTLPKGPDFLEYRVFAQGYEALKKATNDFRNLEPDGIIDLIYRIPISLIVLRTILGFTPPEWAHVASEESHTEVPQGAARSIERKIRTAPIRPMRTRTGITADRIRALVVTGCELLQAGAPGVPDNLIHRLSKADTAEGVGSIQHVADFGVPYSMLLYERYLGRSFAAHRDSVSELIGDVLESAIEKTLHSRGISFRKTGRAERIPGFDQAPDFVIPDEFRPEVVIEAKVTEDDGTARDKVTRVQHLQMLAMKGRPADRPRFEVVAAISGRGFKVRREDMKKLLLATQGKVFTLQNLNRLVECTRASEFETKR